MNKNVVIAALTGSVLGASIVALTVYALKPKRKTVLKQISALEAKISELEAKRDSAAGSTNVEKFDQETDLLVARIRLNALKAVWFENGWSV